MAIRIENNEVKADYSFEKELVGLCLMYPKLFVVAAHPARAGSAAVQFYANLPLDMRKRTEMSKYKWEVAFDNGSSIRFMTFDDNERSPVPEPPVHVLINYGRMNIGVLNNMAQVMGKYDGELKEEHASLFPLLFDGAFIFSGEQFMEEASRVERKAREKNMASVVGSKKNPDVSKYQKAQEILDDEGKVMRVFEDELLQTRQADLEQKKHIRDMAKLKRNSYY